MKLHLEKMKHQKAKFEFHFAKLKHQKAFFKFESGFFKFKFGFLKHQKAILNSIFSKQHSFFALFRAENVL